jgi:hypothetical protein
MKAILFPTYRCAEDLRNRHDAIKEEIVVVTDKINRHTFTYDDNTIDFTHEICGNGQYVPFGELPKNVREFIGENSGRFHCQHCFQIDGIVYDIKRYTHDGMKYTVKVYE